MARSRNIKPGFFTNDLLAEIDPLGRILFAGLWTIADREGRLQDRPKKIKAEVLPFDNCDVDVLLFDLHKLGFIQRYVIDSIGFIQVCNWEKHQNPHVKESASTIQAPDKNSSSTIQAPEIPERARLIPDSLNLIPDSLNPSKPYAAQPAAAQPKKGSRLSPDFELTAELREFCITARPDLDPEGAFATFRDYWVAQPGAKGCKLDWPATWRNWVRNSRTSQTRSAASELARAMEMIN
jgi:hypothetical protein